MGKDKTVKKLTKLKLTKILIIRFIMAGLSVVCLVLGVIFNCIKTPIENSIYRINSSLAEREEIWESKREELFEYYDKIYPASQYENRMETYGFTTFSYEVSYSNFLTDTKQLNLEIINFTKNSVKVMGSIYIQNKENNTLYERIQEVQNKVFATKESAQYSVIVDADFEINNYRIYINNIDDNLDGLVDWDRMLCDSYEDLLENTKISAIYNDIEEIIGERPTAENESAEPRPSYMTAIMNARLRYIICYVCAVCFLVLAILIRKWKGVQTSLKPVYNNIQKEIIIKEIHHHAVKAEKVVCLYCGSRYNDNLEGCPSCGANKIIKEETNTNKDEKDNV